MRYRRARIIHFAGLTTIRQPAEIVKKTRRLRNLCQSSRRKPSPSSTCDSVDATDSGLQPFVANLFTRLPWRYVRTDFQFLEVFAILVEGSSSARDWLKAILPITPAIGESGRRVRNTKLGSILWDTPGGATPRRSRRRIQRRAFSRPAGSSLTSRATTIDGWLRSNIGQEPWRSGFSEPTTNTIE